MDEILKKIREIPGWKIDDMTGRLYFEKCPEGFRKGTLDDFHVKGKKKIGMIYLLHGALSNYFYPRIVTDELKASSLVHWIKAGRLYVQL